MENFQSLQRGFPPTGKVGHFLIYEKPKKTFNRAISLVENISRHTCTPNLSTSAAPSVKVFFG